MVLLDRASRQKSQRVVGEMSNNRSGTASFQALETLLSAALGIRDDWRGHPWAKPSKASEADV